jgi:hypothetical protein
MARYSPQQWLALRLRVPRGYEDFWRLIRERCAKGGTFTVTDIADETNVQRQSVEHYVARLRAGGYVALARPAAGNKPNLFKLLKCPAAAPRLRDDGSDLGTSVQERLWRGMRALVNFSTRELAFVATVDPKQPVPLKTVQRYINQLVVAGYLDARGASRRPATYRLKPGMNTGPKPPSILRAQVVWDRNFGKLMGEPVCEVAS